MAKKRLLIDHGLLSITISRLCHQLVEDHDDFSETVILGLQPRGIFFAERVRSELQKILSKDIDIGYLDTTFYRDDFRRRESPIKANATKVPFIIENKKVILVDDVLFTGRTVRAALDAMTAFGRPREVNLLILIDRKYERDLPIAPTYVGRQVNTIQSQQVRVELVEQGRVKKDSIWLVNKDESDL